MRIAILSLAAALAACTGLEPLEPQRITRAAGSGDASSAEAGAKDLADAKPKLGCGGIGPVGCCDGETLWWCEQGGLKSLACGARPRCGWNPAAKLHDCNTSGAGDPTGGHARECFLVTDAALPKTDGPVRDGGGECQGVKTEGCCDGNTLLYCVDGVLRALHCGLNPSCGWLANAQFYDCGTEGKEDPKGVHKRQCPIRAPDGLAFGLRDARVLEASADGPRAGDVGTPKDGCDCALAAAPGPAGLWLLLGALALAARRRQVR